MKTVYERRLEGGWINMDNPNSVNADWWNDGTSYLFLMHHPESGKYSARVESTNVRDIWFEIIGVDRDSVLQRAIFKATKNHNYELKVKEQVIELNQCSNGDAQGMIELFQEKDQLRYTQMEQMKLDPQAAAYEIIKALTRN